MAAKFKRHHGCPIPLRSDSSSHSYLGASSPSPGQSLQLAAALWRIQDAKVEDKKEEADGMLQECSSGCYVRVMCPSITYKRI